MGRSQRHKVYHQKVASNDEQVAQGTAYEPVMNVVLASDGQPILTSISPNSAEMGSADLTLTVTGEKFNETTVILFNHGEENTTLISDTQVSTIVKPSLVTLPGSYPVQVALKGVPATASAGADFTFTEPVVPPPPAPPPSEPGAQ